MVVMIGVFIDDKNIKKKYINMFFNKEYYESKIF